jgi:nitrite reductase (NO-forming)
MSSSCRAALILTLTTTLAACEQTPPVTADPHDPARMDLAPRRATVSTERPPNPAVQLAVQPLPTLFPVDPAPVKEVRLDATNKVIDLAPGVKFAGWTFGHQIPGPTVRVRVKDRVRFVMTNRSDEAIGGINVSPAMMHSMDFHSAMVSPQDKYRSIAPGETIRFEFTANYPGVYLYHCGTPPILEHVAAGMYGMMIVEPESGYPGKVDREYALVQSEFYAKPDPQGRKVDGVPLYVVDPEAMRDKRPSHVVFNGRFNGLVERPIPAKPGERVRLFVLNAGPSDTSSFHVVGTIFDRVYPEGNLANQMRGMQTTLLGASNGTVVEFVIPEKGKYVMVDHEFADASKGAIGIIDASDGEGPAETVAAGHEHGHHGSNDGAAKPPSPTERMAKARELHTQRCVACHDPPAGMMRMAPDLQGVTDRHSREWLTKWLTDTAKMLNEDAVAQKLQQQWKNIPMPNTNLSAEQVDWMIDFLRTERAAAKRGSRAATQRDKTEKTSKRSTSMRSTAHAPENPS